MCTLFLNPIAAASPTFLLGYSEKREHPLKRTTVPAFQKKITDLIGNFKL